MVADHIAARKHYRITTALNHRDIQKRRLVFLCVLTVIIFHLANTDRIGVLFRFGNAQGSAQFFLCLSFAKQSFSGVKRLFLLVRCLVVLGLKQFDHSVGLLRTGIGISDLALHKVIQKFDQVGLVQSAAAAREHRQRHCTRQCNGHEFLEQFHKYILRINSAFWLNRIRFLVQFLFGVSGSVDNRIRRAEHHNNVLCIADLADLHADSRFRAIFQHRACNVFNTVQKITCIN